MRCLIVDDEPLASDVIENYINKIESLNIVAKCNSALQAINVKTVELVNLLLKTSMSPIVRINGNANVLKATPELIARMTHVFRSHVLMVELAMLSVEIISVLVHVSLLGNIVRP